MLRFGSRLSDWIERRPPRARPPLYGALFVFVATGLKAGPIGLVALLIVLWKSASPLLVLAQVIGLFAAVLLAGAAAGLAYDRLGRRLLSRGGFSASLGAFVTVLPYSVGAAALLFFAERGARPSDVGALVAITLLCTWFFGVVVLKSFFIELATDGGAAASSESRARAQRGR